MKHDPNTIEFGIGPSLFEWCIIIIILLIGLSGIVSLVLLVMELLK